MRQRTSLLVLAFFVACALGCTAEEKATDSDQIPVDTGTFPEYGNSAGDMVAEVRALCAHQGLSVLENFDTERQVRNRDHRIVYDITCAKRNAAGNKVVAAWLSNIASDENFIFQLYREPFPANGYSGFRASFRNIIGKYSPAGRSIAYSMRDGVEVR